MLDEQVGYVRISSFSASTGTEMANAVKSLIDQQARGIVVDLRNNPGGYLSTSVEALAQFIDPGSVVLYQQSGNGDRKTYRTEGGGTAAQIPGRRARSTRAAPVPRRSWPVPSETTAGHSWSARRRLARARSRTSTS